MTTLIVNITRVVSWKSSCREPSGTCQCLKMMRESDIFELAERVGYMTSQLIGNIQVIISLLNMLLTMRMIMAVIDDILLCLTSCTVKHGYVLPGLQHRSWLQPGEDDEQLLFHPIAPTLTSSMTSTFSKFWSIYIDITPFLFPMSIDVSSQLQDWSTRLASMRIYNLSSGGKGFKVKSQNNNTKIKSQNNNTKIKSRSSWSRRWSDRGPAWVRSCSKPLIW